MKFVLLAALTGLVAGAIYVVLYVGRRERNLPRGPPTLPILGNIHQIPKKGAHFQFTKWAKQYGGIYTLKIGTGTLAVLTDRRLVKQLVDKKSAIYSKRPASFLANYISGGDHILLMDYNSQWRGARKVLHGTLTEKAVDERHSKVVEVEARQMLRDYLVKPEEHMLHPGRYSNSITMSTIWGVRTPHTKTRHMQRLYSLMHIWSRVMETGASPPVDVYPVLHYLPQSVFLGWRDRAADVRREMNSLYSDLLTDIRMRRSKEGSGRGALMDDVLDQAEGNAKKQDGLTYSDHEMWFLGGTVTEGGSDTSAAMIIAFVQAMIAFPDVQARAHRQLDSVVGRDRSPTWADYSALPYVAQCVKETMRWRPVTPLAFPHALADDDWVDGQFLPRGTTVLVNVWGLQHDPLRFRDPDVFDPDHFAGSTDLAPQLANGPYELRDHYGYGTGRRFCPGAHLAERNMFLAMAKLLWAFEIGPGARKPDTDPVTGYSEGFVVCANDFEAEFKVRGEERRETIVREFAEVEQSMEKFDALGEEKA